MIVSLLTHIGYASLDLNELTRKNDAFIICAQDLTLTAGHDLQKSKQGFHKRQYSGNKKLSWGNKISNARLAEGQIENHRYFFNICIYFFDWYNSIEEGVSFIRW